MKVAISLPDPVFDAAERLAHELNISRSQLYAQALATFLKQRSALDVTARLNEVYGNESVPIEPAVLRAQWKSVGYEAW